MNHNPTKALYRLLDAAYAHFNQQLFGGRLPACMLTLQRYRNTMGYFSAERWVNDDGDLAHEIALNPAYFAQHRVIEVLQTLVHEQCHLWQHLYGYRKSRTSYHNREWAEKMHEIGLMPSSTGEVGGAQTGQTMSDYPIADGRFLSACIALVKDGYALGWVDTEPALDESCQWRDTEAHSACFEQIRDQAEVLLQPVPSVVAHDAIQWDNTAARAKALSKSKYTCDSCGTNIWGKPGLNVICGLCDLAFAPQEGD